MSSIGEEMQSIDVLINVRLGREVFRVTSIVDCVGLLVDTYPIH